MLCFIYLFYCGHFVKTKINCIEKTATFPSFNSLSVIALLWCSTIGCGRGLVSRTSCKIHENAFKSPKRFPFFTVSRRCPVGWIEVFARPILVPEPYVWCPSGKTFYYILQECAGEWLETICLWCYTFPFYTCSCIKPRDMHLYLPWRLIRRWMPPKTI